MTFNRRPGVTYLYTLAHPRTGEVRYVGKTATSPRQRFNSHMCRAITERPRQQHLAHWIQQLDREALRPKMTVVAILQTETASQTEIAYISRLRADGAKLTNLTDGGEGQLGYAPTTETLVKLSVARRGKKQTPETCAKISEALRGKPKSPEHVERQAAGHRGLKRTPEQIAALSAALRGKKRTPEQRRHYSEAMRKIWQRPGHYEKWKASVQRTLAAKRDGGSP